MLRDLSIVLQDLHQGLTSAVGNQNLSLHIINAEMLVPMDIRVIFRDGGMVLQGDVPRALNATHWFDDISHLHILWQEIPTEELLHEL